MSAMLFRSWSNLLVFCIHNQLDEKSIEEDRVNNPWRPLPSGRITFRQSMKLLVVSYPLVILYCGIVGGLRRFVVEAIVRSPYLQLLS